MFNYNNYLINLDFDIFNINAEIYLEIQDEITKEYFSININKKYLKENIKLIKQLDKLYYIINIGFNTAHNI
jgi:hypothetical protein